MMSFFLLCRLKMRQYLVVLGQYAKPLNFPALKKFTVPEDLTGVLTLFTIIAGGTF